MSLAQHCENSVMKCAYIVDAIRSPMGKKNGALSALHPVDLGAYLIDELVKRNSLPTDAIDDLVFGVVNQVGAQGGNLARNVGLSSSLSTSVPGTTIDRQCGSSLQALQFAAQAVMSGTQGLIVAGGVEAMSLVPIGSSILDGAKCSRGRPKGQRLEQAYPGVKFNQFDGAEMLAEKYQITREELDTFGLESHRRAAHARSHGYFLKETIPLPTSHFDSDGPLVTDDECIRVDASIEAMRSLKPLRHNGFITAGTASQISDGAAVVLVAGADAIARFALKPRAKIIAFEVIGSDPVMMLEGPIPATESLLAKAGLCIADIDLYEINEAFGSVPLAWLKALKADPEKLNVNGGAQALGHPLGASGARLIVTLLHELERRGLRYGLAAVCEGGGTANAMIIESVSAEDFADPAVPVHHPYNPMMRL